MNVLTKIALFFKNLFQGKKSSNMGKMSFEPLKSKSVPHYDPDVVDQKFIRGNFYYDDIINELVSATGTHKVYRDKKLKRKRLKINGKYYYHSRLVFMYFYGEIEDGVEIDHIDRNKSNDCIHNLRKATRKENSANRAGTSKIGYKGVTKNGNRWRARIGNNGKIISIGNYETPEEAALAYDNKAIELFGYFAYTNFHHAPIKYERLTSQW